MKYLSFSLQACLQGLVLATATMAGAVHAAQAPATSDTPDAGANDAAEPSINPTRLWLPNASNELQGLLLAAAFKALEHPDCKEVLSGRLNEYRTQTEGTTFTILCLRDPAYTFNLIYAATELEAADGELETQTTGPADTNDLRRLRELLGDIPASVEPGAEEEALPEPPPPQDTVAPELF